MRVSFAKRCNRYTPDCLSLCLSVTLWHYFNKRSTVAWFSPNDSLDTIYGGDVKISWKLEEYYAVETNIYRHPHSGIRKALKTNTLAASCLLLQ